MCTCRIDSLCCTAETNRTWYSNYTPTKINFLKKGIIVPFIKYLHMPGTVPVFFVCNAHLILSITKPSSQSVVILTLCPFHRCRNRGMKKSSTLFKVTHSANGRAGTGTQVNSSRTITQALNHTAPGDTVFAAKIWPFRTLQATSSFSNLVFHVSQAAHELGTQDYYRRIHELELIIPQKNREGKSFFFFHFTGILEDNLKANF